jgi:hypothetical protein
MFLIASLANGPCQVRLNRPPKFSLALPSKCRRFGELQSDAPKQMGRVYSVWENHMSFEIVAERESETVRMKKNSSLIAIANARVWASEGWKVTIIVGDEAAPALVEECAPLSAYAEAISVVSATPSARSSFDLRQGHQA